MRFKADSSFPQERKQSPRQLPPTTLVVAEIDRWEWDYSFEVSPRNPEREWRNTEYRHLNFIGNLIRPSRLKLRPFYLTLIPNGSEIANGPAPSPSIGHFGRSRKRWEPVIGIPATALSPILIVADRLKFAALNVDADIRKGSIYSLTLMRTIDDEYLVER